MTRPLLSVLVLTVACASGGSAGPAPVDRPPPEPPAVLADLAPAPVPEPEPEPEPPPAPTLDLLATARERGLTTFLAAVEAAGLRDTLSGPGPLTLLAPSDAAFAAIPKAELDRILKSKKKVAALVQRHVISGASLQVAALTASPPADLPPDLHAHVTAADVAASNGVLHVLDVVLREPKAGAAKAGAPKPADPKLPADVAVVPAK